MKASSPMTCKILAFLLFVSTLNFAQSLPEAPKPKPHKPAPRLTFISVKDHKKAYVFSGIAAAAIATTALILVNRGPRQTFKNECACPAKVPIR